MVFRVSKKIADHWDIFRKRSKKNALEKFVKASRQKIIWIIKKGFNLVMLNFFGNNSFRYRWNIKVKGQNVNFYWQYCWPLKAKLNKIKIVKRALRPIICFSLYLCSNIILKKIYQPLLLKLYHKKNRKSISLHPL
jgi:hypothetical protein